MLSNVLIAKPYAVNARMNLIDSYESFKGFATPTALREQQLSRTKSSPVLNSAKCTCREYLFRRYLI